MNVKPHINPVFLHGMWRCGSTYVWSLFRSADTSYCYYEPLYQMLARVTPERIDRVRPEQIAQSSHPALNKPYFDEFKLLIRGRGVQNFKAGLAYERFILERGEHNRALKTYLDGLIDFAQNQGKVPVFGFNRTSYRLGWLKDAFPSAVHIYIDRDPVAVWRSYEGQRKQKNYTFFGSWIRIIESNQAHPFMKALAEKLGLRGPFLRHFGKPKRWHAVICEKLSPEQTYFMVFCLWLTSLLQGLSAADEIFDMSRAGHGDYNAECSARISALTGVEVSFSEAQTYEFDGERGPVDFAAIEAEALRFLKTIVLPDWDKEMALERSKTLTPRKRDLILALCG